MPGRLLRRSASGRRYSLSAVSLSGRTWIGQTARRHVLSESGHRFGKMQLPAGLCRLVVWILQFDGHVLPEIHTQAVFFIVQIHQTYSWTQVASKQAWDEVNDCFWICPVLRAPSSESNQSNDSLEMQNSRADQFWSWINLNDSHNSISQSLTSCLRFAGIIYDISESRVSITATQRPYPKKTRKIVKYEYTNQSN